MTSAAPAPSTANQRPLFLHSQIKSTSAVPNPNPPPPIPKIETDETKNPRPHHRTPHNLRIRTDADMAEPIARDHNNSAVALSSLAVAIDGSDEDAALSRSEFLTRQEVLRRRSRRLKQLAKVYRKHYWVLMEELKHKYREYYWEYGKSPFQEDEDRENRNRAEGTLENGSNGNINGGDRTGLGLSSANRCGVHGCKSKAMALTMFCHMHVLSDAKQKLYKPCSYAIKSSPTGPIFCGKPILRSTVPSLCHLHFEKAEKHMVRALKKAGLNVTSTSKLAPKFHIIVAEYVRQIQCKRRAAQKAVTENAEIKEDSSL